MDKIKNYLICISFYYVGYFYVISYFFRITDFQIFRIEKVFNGVIIYTLTTIRINDSFTRNTLLQPQIQCF